jgi:carbon-monoxide dehydrogenase medium subunit
MYLAELDYTRAGSPQEAVALLQDRENAKLLAGGHSLIPLLKLRTALVGTLIDIGQISEMKGISVPNGSVSIGPLTTHSELARSESLPAALRDAAGNIGDLQVRNRGTIGGNVSHADPASDLPTVLTALGATFYVYGPSGQRFIPASSFFSGMFETALGEHEILTGIEVPVHKQGTGSAYAKFSNPASGYAMLGAAAVITLDGSTCSSARVAVGGVTPGPTRAPSVENALVGKTLDGTILAAAAAAVEDDLGDFLLGDIHASETYRKAMAPVFLRRALASAWERARN